VEREDDLIVGAQDTVTRKMGLGVFLGSEQFSQSPDGRQIRMFRGIEKELHEAILHDGKAVGRRLPSRNIPTEHAAYFSETIFEKRTATVRSVSIDGSLFEVQIS
jgi:hypothetical protein